MSALKIGGSVTKIIFFELCKNSFIRKLSIFTFKVSKLEEVSHEMLFLALPSFKLGGHSCVLLGREITLEAW